MRAKLNRGIFCAFFSSSVCAASPVYVSPSGSDRWSGAEPESKAGTTTGPKKTLEEALRVARAQRKSAAFSAGPIEIILRGGTYELADTVTMTADDSGTPSSPLVIRAQQNETPVLSGGTALGFVRQTDSLWTAAVPAGFEDSPFSQLYVGGERRPRVRMPKHGYYQVAGAVDTGNPKARYAFRFAEGDISPSPEIKNVVVRAFQKWTVCSLRIAQVDGTSHIVTFGEPVPGTERIKLDRTSWYILENVAGAPLAAGEWYLDRKSRELRYAPLNGELAAGTRAVAPRLETLLRMEGEKGAAPKIENVIFSGITFAHTDWKLPSTEVYPVQGAVDMPGTVEVSSARAIVFRGCFFRATGAYALVLGADVQHSTVEESVFVDLGAGGIRIGSADDADRNVAAQWTANCVVKNNIVMSYGRVHPAGIGLWVGLARGTLIEHNEVTDGYYTGISVGWVWDYGLFAPRDNLVRQNRIWHIGQRVLSDLGGIYTLGEQPGTEIYGNEVSDVQGARYGGWGIYCDEGSASIAVENNLAFNFSASAVHLHWGRDLRFAHNLLALGRDYVFENSSPEATGAYTFSNNILVTKSEPFLGGGVNPAARLDHNLYHVIDGNKKLFPERTGIDSWKQSEPDASTDDPAFGNPLAGDFTSLRPDLLKARGIDLAIFHTAGRIRGPVLAYEAKTGWDPAPEPRQIQFFDNFDQAGDAELAEFETSFSRPAQDIKLSSERSHSAPNSLMLADGPSASAWEPLASQFVHITNGQVHVSFWLWVEKGAVPWIALRDVKEPSTDGPVVSLSSDRKLTAGSSTVMAFPYECWFKIDITFGVGTFRTETWNLVVTPSSGEPAKFSGLPMPQSFINFDWLGIAGNGSDSAKFFVDDLAVTFSQEAGLPTTH